MSKNRINTPFQIRVVVYWLEKQLNFPVTSLPSTLTDLVSHKFK